MHKPIKNDNKRDKLKSGPYATGSFGISTSSNISAEASGFVDENSDDKSLLPHFSNNGEDNKKA